MTILFGAYANAQASLDLIIQAAEKYIDGEGIDKDVETGIGLLLRGIERYPNDPRGYETLALIYSNEKYGEQDIAKAFAFYEHAAHSLNSENAKLKLSGLLLKHGDPKKASSLLSGFKNTESAEYNYYLGVLYLEGIAYPQNLERSQHHLEIAYQKGYQLSLKAIEGLQALRVARIAQQTKSSKLKKLENNMSNACSLTGRNEALNTYCRTDSCSGFSSRYKLWDLCHNNSAKGYSSEYGVWSYLKNKHTNHFSEHFLSAAISCQDSFSNRKEFVIYWANGYVRYCK